jgi:hypothetical protein
MSTIKENCMTKDEALKIVIEGIKVTCFGVLAGIAVVTAFTLIIAWLKLSCKFLEYVWGVV